jgi:hypothetical protein
VRADFAMSSAIGIITTYLKVRRFQDRAMRMWENSVVEFKRISQEG